MAYDFKFPDVGEGIHEGKIVKWLIKEGDTIKADQALAEVETDKAVVEIPSPKAGKLLKVFHKEGDTIQVGAILASIEESGNAVQAAPDAAAVVGKLEVSGESVLKAPSLESSGAVFASGGAAPKKTTPVAKTVEAKVESVKASLPEKSAEVKVASPASDIKPAPAVKITKKYDLFGYVDRVKYDGIRKAVGDHMVKSMFTIPHVTHTDLADVTKLFQVREKEKKAAEKQGIKLTFLPFIVKAVVAGLKKHPFLNASLDEENGEIILKKYFNIGIAVDTEAGLMVPVIKGADNKSILSIAKEIGELAEKARARKLSAMDMKGGTFTITNIGSTGGGWFATPVINFPEAAIIGTGMIQDMVVPRNGKPAIRKILPLSLAFDHRVFDGAEAARFVNTLKEHLEDPDLMLVE